MDDRAAFPVVAAAATVYSEDLHAGQSYQGVTVEDPFAA